MPKKKTTKSTPKRARAKTASVSHMPEGGYWESPVQKVSYFPQVVEGLDVEFVPKEEKQTQAKVEVEVKKKEQKKKKAHVKMKATKPKPISVTSQNAAKNPEYLVYSAIALVLVIGILVGVLVLVAGETFRASAGL